MKVGVTGATGFLGRCLCAKLTQAGHEVVGWSRKKRPPNIHPQDDANAWVIGPLGEKTLCQQFASQVDAVVHAAVDRHGAGFIGTEGDPVEYFQRNVMGSLQLFEAATQYQVQRFVFVSSGAVHQRVVPGVKLDEQHPLWPASIYGAYKAAVETLVHSYGFSEKLNCCTLRPTSIYGIQSDIEQTKWIDLIRRVMNGQEVQPNGGSKSVHVDDVADATIALLTTSATVAGETFNCCDRWISDHEVATIAKSIVGSKSPILGTPQSSSTTIDTSKIESLGVRFGGTAKLQQTIQQMIDAITAG